MAAKTKLEGRVVTVLVSLSRTTLMSTRTMQATVTLEGVTGDVHAGFTRLSDSRTPHFPRGTIIRNSRQVSAVSLEELAEIAAAMTLPNLQPDWLGANLALRDIPRLTQLPPGTRLFFPQDTVLVVEGENTPCRNPGAVIQSQYPNTPNLVQSFMKAAKRKRGLVLWVERPGVIRPADTVRVELAPKVSYSYT